MFADGFYVFNDFLNKLSFFKISKITIKLKAKVLEAFGETSTDISSYMRFPLWFSVPLKAMSFFVLVFCIIKSIQWFCEIPKLKTFFLTTRRETIKQSYKFLIPNLFLRQKCSNNLQFRKHSISRKINILGSWQTKDNFVNNKNSFQIKVISV